MYKIRDGLSVMVYDLETDYPVPVAGQVEKDLLEYVSTFTVTPIAQHLSDDGKLVYDFIQTG